MATQTVPSAAANGKHGHSLISDAKFRRLYELTLRLRLEVSRSNGRGHALAGREAALAAVSSDLRPGDALVTDQPIPTAVYLAETTAPFAERVIAAIARATADRLKKNSRVAVIFSTRATDDLLREAHALAGAARLPVLFVEDASATPPKTKSRARSASGANLISIPVDAQDVIALYRVAHESMVRAREGSGPTRILCSPWPSRSKQTEDAVEHLERWLQARGLPAQDWRSEILASPGAATSRSREKVFTEVL
jgi:TPP-dependent pyruvate/acetoin dehydrogenase alpha subunit